MVLGFLGLLCNGCDIAVMLRGYLVFQQNPSPCTTHAVRSAVVVNVKFNCLRAPCPISVVMPPDMQGETTFSPYAETTCSVGCGSPLTERLDPNHVVCCWPLFGLVFWLALLVVFVSWPLVAGPPWARLLLQHVMWLPVALEAIGGSFERQSDRAMTVGLSRLLLSSTWNNVERRAW